MYTVYHFVQRMMIYQQFKIYAGTCILCCGSIFTNKHIFENVTFTKSTQTSALTYMYNEIKVN